MLSLEVLHRPAARVLLALPALVLLSGAPVRASTTLHAYSNQYYNGQYSFGRLVQAPDGFLYGTTVYGGAGAGTIFREDPTTNILTLVYSFTGGGAAGTGSYPASSLIAANDGKLYGTTEYGGQYGAGTAFCVSISTSPVTVTKIHDFQAVAANGAYPIYDSVIQASDTNLYGTTNQGGTYGAGTVWKMALNGSGFTVLHSFHTTFATDGGYPYAGVVEGNDGRLYGAAYQGGANNYGAVYYLNKDGTGFGLAHSFINAYTDGRNPQTALTKGTDGKLYGTTYYGGFYDAGTVYSIDPGAGNAFSIVYNFDGETGAYPYSPLSVDNTGNLYGTTSQGGANGYGTAFMLDPSLTFSDLVSFNGADALYPYAPPILAANGNLYGDSEYGGLEVQLANSTGYGSLYSITIDPVSGAASSTLLHSLNQYEDGFNPQSRPVLGADGNLYGVTINGGVLNQGVFYQATPAGGYQILHTFNSYAQEGYQPRSVIQGPDGNFYGTCLYGGRYGYGTVWMSDSSGNLTVLHHFRSRDGSYPWGRLLFGQDGNLYGATVYGGFAGYGTVFKLATDGSGFADIHDFDPSFNHDGYSPFAGLVQDAGGTLYGATLYGGAYGYGAFFKLNTNGTGYALIHILTYADGAAPFSTPVLSGGIFYAVCNSGGSGYGTLVSVATATGTTTNLHSFNYSTEGAFPYGDLFLAGDGNLYGTNNNGGPSSGSGTAWKSTIAGAVTVLQTFNASTGRFPRGGVVLDAAGVVYGTTTSDGPNGGGTLYSIP